MSEKDTNSAPKNPATIVTHHGRAPKNQHGFVNTPIVRGSTVIFDSYEQIKGQRAHLCYGRYGNPTDDAVRDVITELEHGADTLLAHPG